MHTRRITFLAAATMLAASTAHAELPDSYEQEIRGRTISVPSSFPGYFFPSLTSISGRDVSINDSGDVAIEVASVPGQNPEDSFQAVWANRGGSGGIAYTGVVSPSFDARFSEVLIDDTGRLYWAESPFGGAPKILFQHPGSRTRTVTSQPLGTSSYDSLRVNDLGQMASVVSLGAGHALVRVSGVSSPTVSVLLTDSDLDPASPYTFLLSSIGWNDAGQVSIEAWLNGVETLFRFTPPSTMEPLVTDGDTFGDVVVNSIVNGTAINEAGQVAFAVFGDIDAVFRAEPDGSVTLIASNAPGSEIAALGNFPPVMNDAGQVAFRGVGSDGEDAIYIGDGDELMVVTRETGSVPTDLGPGQIGNHVPGAGYTAFSGNIAINSRGDVAYVASIYPEGNNQIEWGHGIFVAVAQDSQVPPDAGVPDASIPPDASRPPDAMLPLPDAMLPPADAGDEDVDAAPGMFDAAVPDAMMADATPGTPEVDATPGDDAGTTPEPVPPPDDGCGCRTGAGGGDTGMLLLLLGVAGYLHRPRRRSV